MRIFALNCLLLLTGLWMGHRPIPSASGSSGVVTAASFSDSQYNRFTYQSFRGYAPANKPIDLRNPDYALLNAAIFYATNAIRAKHNRPVFEFRPTLRNAVQYHCEQMVRQRFFNHRNMRSVKYRTPHQRIKQFGGNFNMTAENIAFTPVMDLQHGNKYYYKRVDNQYVFYDKKDNEIKVHTYNSFAEYVVDAWMKSPGHRKNIMNKDLKYMGCGAKLDNYTMNKKQLPMIKSGQNFGA